MKNIALMGRAGSGKDTVAGILREVYGHERVALADPLKRMALAADPIVAVADDPDAEYADDQGFVHLSYIVNEVGWEDVKRSLPEVRRFLQRLGSEGVRGVVGADTWLRIAHVSVCEAWNRGNPVVITDVRFPNEAAWAHREGFELWWIDRPGVRNGGHVSESALSARDADRVLFNGGSVEDLASIVRAHMA